MLTDGLINLELTSTEAWELLSRCLNSSEADNPASREAMRKLADALRPSATLRMAA